MDKQTREEMALIRKARAGDEEAFRIVVEIIDNKYKKKSIAKFVKLRSHLFPQEDIEQTFWEGVCQAVYKISFKPSVRNGTYRHPGGFFVLLVQYGIWMVHLRRNKIFGDQIIFACSVCRYSGKSYETIRWMSYRDGKGKLGRREGRVECPECGALLKSTLFVVPYAGVGFRSIGNESVSDIQVEMENENDAEFLSKKIDELVPGVENAGKVLRALLEHGVSRHGAIKNTAEKLGVSRFAVHRCLKRIQREISESPIFNAIRE